MDFAYSPQMEGILLFVSTAITVITNYFNLNLVLMLNGETIPLKRKVLFIVAFTVFQQAVIYVSHYTGILELLPAELEVLITFPGPVHMLVFYLLLVKVTGLSKYRSLHVVNEVYLYGLFMTLLTHTAAMAIFPQEAGAYNYLAAMLRSLCALIIFMAAYAFVRQLILKNKLVMRLTNAVTVPHYGRLFAASMLGYSAAFAFAVFVPVAGGNTPLADWLCIAVLLLVLAAYISTMVRMSYYNALKNKDAYIYTLSQGADELRSLKHDINGILQGYGGYIDTGNLTKLEDYHRKVVKIASKASAPDSLAKRLPECPPLVSLMTAKLAYAEEMGVDLQFGISDTLDTGRMNEVDACRVFSILLDNAIEAAAGSADKRARVSYQVKNNGNRLFVVTNSIAAGTEQPQPGVSTKGGHSGLGLKTVRKILGRYPRCTYNLTWYQDECTAYLEIPPQDEAAEPVCSAAIYAPRQEIGENL